jgi:hypothetical protein
MKEIQESETIQTLKYIAKLTRVIQTVKELSDGVQ